MPKKSRTPPPPRRVQAPKQRSAPRQPADRRLLVIGAVAVVVVAAAAAGAFFFLGGESAEATIRNAGCDFERQPAQAGRHVEEVSDDFEYNTDPATSGPHHPIPAPYDVYEEPVEQLRLIHNMEHGGIVIQYGEDVPRATVDRMIAWYREDPNGLVIAPLPRLGDTITLAAWLGPEDGAKTGRGVLAKCPTFDEAAFDAFKDEYGFRGPELFPREELRPGT